MCLYVFVSRGCFRHRSALANGFFVASISIPFALFVSLSLMCSFVLSSCTFPQITTPLLCDDLSLLSSFSSQSVSVEFFLGQELFGERFGGKFIFQKSPFVDSSLLYYTRSRIRAIKYVSLLLIARRTPVRSLSLTLSWLRACGCVFVGGHIRTRWKQNQISSPFIPFGLCKRVRAFSKDVWSEDVPSISRTNAETRSRSHRKFEATRNV